MLRSHGDKGGRGRVRRGRDRRRFSKTANRVHGANFVSGAMRGGIRL